ncbi:hypothetical protein AAHB45_02350 [Pediococcus pentosaceus]|uniref:hypothetical protein n=1 Tax=Pediococcus pentosaceus TaxID=1255 RepID=UPI0031664AD6
MAEVDFKDNVTPFPTHAKQDYQNGGGNGMDKYVTHQELEYQVEKLSNKMDVMDVKDELRVEKSRSSLIRWYIGTTIALGGILITVIGMMISNV